jgi:hypothetical protein
MDSTGVDESARLDDYFGAGHLVASDEPADYDSCQVFPVWQCVPTATLTPMPRLPGLRSGLYAFKIYDLSRGEKPIFWTMQDFYN